MKTPICDFVTAYQSSAPLRLHMPGHKGVPVLGMEPLDITEIVGADVLYSADGIIAESRENARKLFGTRATFYATEGSSLCIRAMVYLVQKYALASKKKPCIWAARNVHKSFLYAVAMSDIFVTWLYPESPSTLLSCQITAAEVDAALTTAEEKPAAVYLTSPDYLGSIADIKGIAEVCHRHGVLLLVDNAHGAYLQFLPESIHPMALGADLCCDSAHKTLPALTGAAYLHVGIHAPAYLAEHAERALAMFASTSPSYLTLQSLDRLNPYLASEYPTALAQFLAYAEPIRAKLSENNIPLLGDEPLKWTIRTKDLGYTGEQLASLLQDQGIYCEFFDSDYIVFMLSPALTKAQLTRLYDAISAISPRDPINLAPPPLVRGTYVCSVRKALFGASTTRRIEDAEGQVLADACVSCPPAIPILVCGERITREAIEAFRYYHIDQCQTLDA